MVILDTAIMSLLLMVGSIVLRKYWWYRKLSTKWVLYREIFNYVFNNPIV